MRILKLASNAGWEHHKLTFLNHVDKIFAQELNSFLTVFVGASLDCLIDVLPCQGICVELDGGAYVLVQLQETVCWMIKKCGDVLDCPFHSAGG